MKIHIRSVRPDEQDELKRLVGAVGLYVESIDLSGDATFWFAELEGQKVGCIGLEHDTGHHTALMRSAAVLPEYRSQGIARRLTEMAFAEAKARGHHAIYLFSSEAGEYWQGFGFSQVPTSEMGEQVSASRQVQSGLKHGWITEEIGWCKRL